MTPYPFDLFGEVPVTVEDVRTWLRLVPRLDPDSPRAAMYCRSWSVPRKIAAAKMDGSFWSLEDEKKGPPYGEPVFM